jgi:ribulose-5-phosphate 4-epimerase/fuculose-1-phosphate aldolase
VHFKKEKREEGDDVTAAVTKAVVIKNHVVVAIGKDIQQARSIIESLGEWAKILP